MKKGETEEDVDINIEVLPNILKNVLDNSRKRKADGSIDCRQCKTYVSAYDRCCDTAGKTADEDHRGVDRDVDRDRQTRLKEYCN
jgi:hypothetical protein